DDQDASEVAFTPAGNTTSTDVQAAIEELQVEIDGFAAVAGQTNTASNQGAGVGVFLQKTGADLEFKSFSAGSNAITVVNNVSNDEIVIDVNETNLTITESQITDLTHTVDTDDQTASEVDITDAGGNFTATNVEGALSELAASSSDDQNISGSGLASNILTIGIENGTSEDVDLSSLDQSAAVAANAANIATNTTNIATNTADITTNATNITTNSTDIATNTTNITTNATNIATNTTDIATNTTNIAAHIALDDDTDSGNEYNTAFAVNGA